VQKSIGVGVVLLAAFFAWQGTAGAADPRTEKAREHYLQGDAFYKLDRYANALGEYEQAYISKPDPSFLYNIAQCHRLMGNRSEAVKFYRRYLKDAPAAPNREVADKHIKDLEASLAATPEDPNHGRTAALLPVTTPPPISPLQPTSPASSTRPAGTMPAPAALALAPQQPPPGSSDATLGAQAAPAVNPSSDDTRPVYTKWWFWTGVGAVVAGGVILLLAAGGDPSCPAGRICH
jgi:tetratricopeptide (TPR) repeat protein